MLSMRISFNKILKNKDKKYFVKSINTADEEEEEILDDEEEN